jgi:hypothetical protein
MVDQAKLFRGLMIEESLQTYRQERKAFILGLKHYYGIDFYGLDISERKEWLRSYIESKRNFFESMIEYWKDNPPETFSLPVGYRFPRKLKSFSKSVG